MADDVIQPSPPVAPVAKAASVDALTPHGSGAGHIPARKYGLQGRVVAVHRREVHHEDGHVLDVSVGAVAHTEIVVRVESPVTEDIEGRRVTIVLEED